MSRFKKGDYIIGNDTASDRYTITKKGWIGIVFRSRDNFLDVKELDRKTLRATSILDADFSLEAKYFDLLTPSSIAETVVSEEDYEDYFGPIAKVGDYIKINDTAASSLIVGDIYQVIKSQPILYRRTLTRNDDNTFEFVVKPNQVSLTLRNVITGFLYHSSWSCSFNRHNRLYDIVGSPIITSTPKEFVNDRILPVKERFLRDGYKNAPEPIKKKLAEKFPELLDQKTFEEKLETLLKEEIEIFTAAAYKGKSPNYISSNIKPRVIKYSGSPYIVLSYPNANTDWSIQVHDFVKQLVTKYGKNSAIYPIHGKSVDDLILKQEIAHAKANGLYPPSALLVMNVSEHIFK